MGQDTREIRHEVEQARAQLGDTVEALAYKINAPRRIRDTVTAKVERVKSRVTSDTRAAKVRGGVESVKDGVGSAKDSMMDGVETAKDGMGSAKDSMMNGVETAKSKVETAKDTVDQHRNGDRATEEPPVARR